MKERRAYLRIKRNIECVIYVSNCEYNATIIDISENGIAFECEDDVINIGERITFTIHDDYLDVCQHEKHYNDNVNGHVKNKTIQKSGLIRYGCAINDINYNRYIQDQYIALACGSLDVIRA